MKPYLILPILLFASPLFGQVQVIDISVLAKVVDEVRLATSQLEQVKTEVERLGNPATIKLGTAQSLMNSLAVTGVGKTLDDLQASATGSAALHYDGNGLYHAPGELITTADGRQTPRATEAYRKFDAVTRAKAALEDVMRDTEERRTKLRQQINDTLVQLQCAPTVSEVQKLSGVLNAQNAEIGAIDREREAALSRVLVQQIENQTDAARQELAKREESEAVFRAASEKLSSFLTPDSSPIRIPDPRTPHP